MKFLLPQMYWLSLPVNSKKIFLKKREMKEEKMKTENIDQILEELIAQQQNKLLSFAREIRPTMTSDDLLQPMTTLN